MPTNVNATSSSRRAVYPDLAMQKAAASYKKKHDILQDVTVQRVTDFPIREKFSKQSSFQSEIEKDGPLDQWVMGLFLLLMIVFTWIILFGDSWLLPKDTLEWCHAAQQGLPLRHYKNIDAIRDPCYYERTWYLLGWSMFECDFGRRMIAAVVLGALIGYERKAADRPAGIRTMSLVCLGAATFTMGGQFAFRSSTMGWDAARVSAAIPSGVGFLGSALIWKETTGEKGSANQRNHVHGITTAASVWLSASVGIGVGGALYVMSIWTVVLVVFVLRLGPRLAFEEDHHMGSTASTADEEDNDSIDEGNEGEPEEPELGVPFGPGSATQKDNETLGNYTFSFDSLTTTREEAQRLEAMEEQPKSPKSPKSPLRSRKSMPKMVSFRKQLSRMQRESMRIQDKQVPNLHSD